MDWNLQKLFLQIHSPNRLREIHPAWQQVSYNCKGKCFFNWTRNCSCNILSFIWAIYLLVLTQVKKHYKSILDAMAIDKHRSFRVALFSDSSVSEVLNLPVRFQSLTLRTTTCERERSHWGGGGTHDKEQLCCFRSLPCSSVIKKIKD